MKLSLDKIRDEIREALESSAFVIEDESIEVNGHCVLGVELHIENSKLTKRQIQYKNWSFAEKK